MTHSGAEHCKLLLPGEGSGNSGTLYGINVVPMFNPEPVYAGFKQMVNIPWDNPTCGKSDIAALTPFVLTDTVDWKAWEKASSVGSLVTQQCSNVLWTEELTLRQAVLKCSSEDCEGLSWLQPEEIPSTAAPVTYSPLGTEYPVNNVYTFSACGPELDSTATPTPAPVSVPTAPPSASFYQDVYRHFWKDLPEARSGANADMDPIKINFMYEDYASSASNVSEFLADTGQLFGVREESGDFELSYGWYVSYTKLHDIHGLLLFGRFPFLTLFKVI